MNTGLVSVPSSDPRQTSTPLTSDMSGEASSVSEAGVASEISRIHDTIQESLARDEMVHDKLEALVKVLKRRTLASTAPSQGDSVAVVGAHTTGRGTGGERERLRLEEEGLPPLPPLHHTHHPNTSHHHLCAPVQTLKLELQGTNILLQQNGQLEREIARLCVEVSIS